jgi:hypothetical protein
MLFPCLTSFILGLLLLDHQQNHVDSFSMTRAATRFGKRTLVMNGASYFSESSSSSGSGGSDENLSRRTEFKDLEPLVQSAARRARLDRDMETRGKFAKYGNDLWDLRTTMKRLRAMLVDAITISGGNREHEIDIRKRLRKLEQQDPELMYRMQMAKGLAAQRDGSMEDAEHYIRKALAARSCLPQYNLEGLWVGK